VDVIGKLPAQAETIEPDKVVVQDVMDSRSTLNTAVKRFEKRYIEMLLHEHQWHRTRVASLLGVDRRTLFRKIKSLGIK
jgi:DNA-binding NtrC family response regulator